MKPPFSIRRGLCLLGFCVLSAGAARAQLTILPLGDSITWGYNIDSTAADNGSAGYRYQLFEDLGGSTSDVTFLGSHSDNGSAATGLPLLPASETANEGHNGYTIEGVDAELEGNSNNQYFGGADRSGSNDGGYWLTERSPKRNATRPGRRTARRRHQRRERLRILGHHVGPTDDAPQRPESRFT